VYHMGKRGSEGEKLPLRGHGGRTERRGTKPEGDNKGEGGAPKLKGRNDREAIQGEKSRVLFNGEGGGGDSKRKGIWLHSGIVSQHARRGAY